MATREVVCVVGLGYVGLPFACVVAASGRMVHGVDTDPVALERVRAAASTPEPGLSAALSEAVRDGRLTASHQPTHADVFVIAVPTPLAQDHRPDVSHVFAAADAIRPYMRGGELVCIESTCPVGTADLVASRLPADVDVATCPERVLPGRILRELVEADRVIGGVTATAGERAARFYRGFVRGEVVVTDARTAEAVKLAENAFRDVNIAFANELATIADRVGVDPGEVIRLANRHPRVSILQPGIGVGGHCVAVDPWFLVDAAPDVAHLVRTAREVNLARTAWVVERIRERAAVGSTVACLGLAYKPDCDDLRGSPALAVVEALSSFATVLRVDPNVPGTVPLDDALARADVVVALVAHTAFKSVAADRLVGRVVLDFVGVFA